MSGVIAEGVVFPIDEGGLKRGSEERGAGEFIEFASTNIGEAVSRGV